MNRLEIALRAADAFRTGSRRTRRKRKISVLGGMLIDGDAVAKAI